MNEIKVFGHKSPDTDASASAAVWAWFLNTHRKQKAKAYILDAVNTEAKFVFDYWELDLPEHLKSIQAEEKVAIVDTNNMNELFENINEAEIISIIDHHKLAGNLKTVVPPEIVIQPYASTMTVMYNVMNIEIADLPREIAGLMLSGILSDTLEFRSPTTTETDKDLAEKLSSKLDIDMHEYASKMFEAKSNISHFSAEELIRIDSKIYDVAGISSRVSVLETTNPQTILDRYEEITEAFEKVKKEDSLGEIFLFAIDILNEEATLLVANENIKNITEKAFDVKIENNTLVLPGVVSRKKQILPSLSKA